MELANIVAERSLLAGICQYGKSAYYDVADIVKETSFTVAYNQNIFICIKRAIAQNVDTLDMGTIFSIAEEIGLSNAMMDTRAQSHLNSLFTFPVDEKNIRGFANKIRKLDIVRQLRKKVEKVNEDLLDITGDETITKILSIPENAIFDFARTIDNSSAEPTRIDDGLDAYIDYLATNQVDMLGIPSGFHEFDKMIGGGLRGGAVDVVAARSKVGKSIFSSNVGYHIASVEKLPVLVLDSEMKYEAHLNRLLARASDSFINEIETGKFANNPIANRKVRDTAKLIQSKEIPYYHKCVNAVGFEEQISIMKRWIHKTVGVTLDGKAKKCAIVYDYLKLTSTEQLDNLQEYQLLGFMMIQLHEFACKYDVPILMMLQTNRDGLSKEDASIASGGDRIIFNCSSFSILKMKSDEEIAADGADAGNRKLVNILCRYGEGTEYGNYLNCYFNGSKATIVEGKTKFQLMKEKKQQKEEQDEIPFTESSGSQDSL